MQVLSRISHIAAALALLGLLAIAQTAQKPAPPAVEDISGMYSFLKDGEFVQITVEHDDKTNVPVVSGFVSRYEEGDSEKFLDHLFEKAALHGERLTFTTKPIHGVSFAFDGMVSRGKAKTRAEEGYFLIKGKLTQTTTENKATKSKSRELEMKSFPQVD